MSKCVCAKESEQLMAAPLVSVRNLRSLRNKYFTKEKAKFQSTKRILCIFSQVCCLSIVDRRLSIVLYNNETWKKPSDLRFTIYDLRRYFLKICEVIRKNWINPTIPPKSIPPTIPHGEVPKSKSANQPKIIIKTTEPKRTIAAEYAIPL